MPGDQTQKQLWCRSPLTHRLCSGYVFEEQLPPERASQGPLDNGPSESVAELLCACNHHDRLQMFREEPERFIIAATRTAGPFGSIVRDGAGAAQDGELEVRLGITQVDPTTPVESAIEALVDYAFAEAASAANDLLDEFAESFDLPTTDFLNLLWAYSGIELKIGELSAAYHVYSEFCSLFTHLMHRTALAIAGTQAQRRLHDASLSLMAPHVDDFFCARFQQTERLFSEDQETLRVFVRQLDSRDQVYSNLETWKLCIEYCLSDLATGVEDRKSDLVWERAIAIVQNRGRHMPELTRAAIAEFETRSEDASL